MNLSVFEIIIAHFYYWVSFINLVIKIREVFKNPFSILIKILKNKLFKIPINKDWGFFSTNNVFDN